ncbi:DUF742 domain-containing protein [Kutzneria sp. CA-103260]|uniref:DUF742 domain-containing protein n=1 Tax=Kutzneria sp. CA-103260 TaxID=2802641 RepID=UPI001BF0BD27|nr:DUF742 domain-containing protein [Kutzneria sp. CA-103260]QUQ69505.1 hypothetical protein JJ691_72630 [Kutzneria sp. CA-103260]
MAKGSGVPGGRFGKKFDYQAWAAEGFSFSDPDSEGTSEAEDDAHYELDEVLDDPPRHQLHDAPRQPGAGGRAFGTAGRGLGDMAAHGLDDPPQHGLDEVPNRFEIDGYGNGLFGGPGADLFGEHGFVEGPARSRGAYGLPEEMPGANAFGFAEERPGERSNPGYRGGPPSGPISDPMSGPLYDADGYEVHFVQPPDPEPEPEPAQHEPVVETGSLVRPYTRTGGRTRPDYDLAIEALVSTSDHGRDRDAAVTAEHRSICGLCVETRSVAEIAAHLRLPLGVVRVLIGDMASMGLVLIHQSGLVVGDRPSIEFLERVLSGLRRL